VPARPSGIAGRYSKIQFFYQRKHGAFPYGVLLVSAVSMAIDFENHIKEPMDKPCEENPLLTECCSRWRIQHRGQVQRVNRGYSFDVLYEENGAD
jgi:hypothetical protein